MEEEKKLAGRTSGANIYYVRSRKRSFAEANQDQAPEECSAKRMKPEDIVQIVTTTINKAFDEREKTMENKIVSQIDTKFSTLKTEIKGELRAELAGSLTEDIKHEIEGKMKKEISTSFQLCLAAMVEKTERNLLVSGIKHNADPRIVMRKIGADNGMTEEQLNDARIQRWYPIRQGGTVEPNNSSSKTPQTRTIICVFSSNFFRNQYLEHAPPASSGIRFEIDCPPPYRRAFKDMKKEARKQREFTGVKTKIRLLHHVLVHKIRGATNQSWTIHKEFVPTPDQVKNSMYRGNEAEGGNQPCILDATTTEQAKRVLRVGNYPIDRKDDLPEFLRDRVDPPANERMRSVTVKRGTIHLLCDDEETVKILHDHITNSKIQIEGKTVWSEHF